MSVSVVGTGGTGYGKPWLTPGRMAHRPSAFHPARRYNASVHLAFVLSAAMLKLGRGVPTP